MQSSRSPETPLTDESRHLVDQAADCGVEVAAADRERRFVRADHFTRQFEGADRLEKMCSRTLVPISGL